ncbi:hypothetical protein KI387_000685, partial [Taxus chinensis]
LFVELDMVKAEPLYKRGWLKVLGALHYWLLLALCPSTLAMAEPADSLSYPSPQCMKQGISEKSHLSTCQSHDFALENSIPPLGFETRRLREIAVDYTPEVCHHKPEEEEIAITFDERGGARWRTLTRFRYGSFISRIKCPDGETSGLNCSFYLSSLEGEKTQDEIDFEFLGKDKGIVQTNFYTDGTGNRETIHQLGFDCSEDFHEFTIRWGPQMIEWLIDGKIVRSEKAKEGYGFPSKPMYLYASVWNASYIDEGRWAGPYFGHHAPYICRYKDVHIPVGSEE